jgi:hypothetical protein
MMRRTREKAHEDAWEKARQDLQKLEPYTAAYKAGCNYHVDAEGGHFAVRFLGQEYRVTFPQVSVQSVSGDAPDVATRLIILHYLIHADGAPPVDQWVAFRELPDGLVYDPAFQGRSSLRLRREYGMDVRGFMTAAQAVGGERLTFGDASYMFRVLPRLRMAVILHQGDEEFGPAVNVLFDASAGHYLPTEDLAVLGGMLAGKLIKAAGG